MKYAFKFIVVLLLCIVMLGMMVLTSCDNGNSVEGNKDTSQGTTTDNGTGNEGNTDNGDNSGNNGGEQLPEDMTVVATGVTLNKAFLSLVKGNSETLTATVMPTDTTDKTLTWTSSDTNIATVANGSVTAIGVGSATITVATANGKTATCEVTIEKYYTQGLDYLESADESYYILVGKGNATEVNKIVIPDTYNGKPVKKISENAFANNSKLVSVTMNSYIVEIGASAFYGCSNLNAVTLSPTLEKISDNAFSGCTSLTSITIPNSVTSIGSYVFEDCTSLTSITIPNSVTSIGEDAFYGCTSLTSVTIGNGVTSIGNYAFSGCTNITSATMPTIAISYVPQNSLKTVVINGGTSIGSLAFHGYTSLTSITIGNGVTSIGDYAFLGCKSLTSVTIPNSVTRIGEDAFYGCSKLTSITIPDSVTSIGVGAFYGCTSLTNVTIGNGVTSISDGAFYGCIGLTSVTIGNGVTSIGEDAFYNCTRLTSVTIGNSVTSIGEHAFSGCTSLTSITIPDSVKSIGSSAFSYCTSLESIIVDSENTTYKDIDGNLYTKDGTKLIQYAIGKKDTSFAIPDSVTSIGSYAFRNCTSLTSVTIGNSVTSIGKDAFYGCSSLTSVYISDIVKWCGISFYFYSDNPLYYADNLYLNGELVTELVIPSSVTSISDGAFYGCIGLTSVTIPNSVTSIGQWAFRSCTSLESIIVDSENTAYKDIDGNLYTKDGKTLIRYAAGKTDKSFSIPNGVTSIGFSAFDNCTSLTSITIPNSVTRIGEDAFYGCSKLTSITIPDSVTSIGDEAFESCTSLTSVYISDIAKWCDISFDDDYGDSANPLYYADNLYLNGELVTELVIPSSVTKISDYAFYNCISLTSVTIPNSVTSIGEDAFYGCYKLIEVINKSSLAIKAHSSSYGYVGYYAKEVHTGESKIVNKNGYLFYTYNGVNYLLGYVGEDTDLTLPESYNGGTYEIYNYAFYGCTSLTSVTIPDSVTSIGNRAFEGCTSLTSVYISDIAKWCGISFGSYNANPLYYADNLYLNGELVTELVIPEGVESIGNRAFEGCTSLTSITIPNSVTSIGSYAFYGCIGLTSVTIGNSVTSIGDYAFENCTSLVYNEYGNAYYLGNKDNPYIVIIKAKSTDITSCEIHSNTKVIYYKAFYGCTSLTSITIPNSVTSIGSFAFYGCSSLTSITIPFVGATKDGTSNTHFGYLFGASSYIYNSNYVPASLKTVVITGGSSIGSSAFYGCTSLTSVTIPNSVTSIGDYAFYGCPSLTSVTIPNSVTSIGDYAFYGCTSLTIYCEAASKPSGWDSSWNYSNCPVVWDCKNK